MKITIIKPGPPISAEVEIDFPLYVTWNHVGEYDYMSLSEARIDADGRMVTVARTDENGSTKWEVEVNKINFFHDLNYYLTEPGHRRSAKTDFDCALAGLQAALDGAAGC